jgi:hypothetical protein
MCDRSPYFLQVELLVVVVSATSVLLGDSNVTSLGAITRELTLMKDVMNANPYATNMLIIITKSIQFIYVCNTTLLYAILLILGFGSVAKQITVNWINMLYVTVIMMLCYDNDFDEKWTRY